MKPHLLFAGADWEPTAQSAFSRETKQHGWTVSFSRSGLDVLKRLSEAPCDVVVADQDLPDLQGRLLLDEVSRRHPQVLRFLHSRLTPEQMRSQCVGATHQLLARPCSQNTLSNAIRRAFAFRDWLPCEAVHRLLPNLTKMPSPPDIYFAVVRELQSPYASADKVGSLIARDPMMTAKMLQLANSAVFGLQQEVTDPLAAVMFLGLETTRSLILLAHAFSYFDQFQMPGFKPSQMWAHSLLVGRLARRIAEIERVSEELAGSCYTAGLLHDLGKLVMAANMPGALSEAIRRATARSIPLVEAERELLGASHAEIGAALLGVWGLPGPILEAVALHHNPTRLIQEGFCPLAAVHVANVLAHEITPGGESVMPKVDIDYLANLGLAMNLEKWRPVCLEEAQAPVEA